MANQKPGFRFGLEAEFLLVDRQSGEPLWYDQLDFFQLHDGLAAIKTGDLPGTMTGIAPEAAHGVVMPYVIEGYHMPADGDQQERILPKGVEIRTPVCGSIEECLSAYRLLFQRMRDVLGEMGYMVVAMSHHPTRDAFQGPQAGRRHDYWHWAMEAMTTYGPDFNISVPSSVWDPSKSGDLEAKINHYSPAMAAVSLASPFYKGEPWRYLGRAGRSFRMHKRSYIAPPVEIHPHESGRLEYKDFDMPTRIGDFQAYFLLFLGLLLSPELTGRASRQTRIYELGRVARDGLAAEGMRERLGEILAAVPPHLQAWGFDPTPLDTIRERLHSGRTPADEMLAQYAKDQSLSSVLRYLNHHLETETRC